MDDWQFDLPGDSEYPVYIRGQAEEVLPGVLTPMMSTLGASIVERAWRRHFVKTLRIIDEPTALHTFFPIIGGRSYVNLSVSARAASLSLGVRAEDFAEQFAVGEEFVRSATERREVTAPGLLICKRRSANSSIRLRPTSWPRSGRAPSPTGARDAHSGPV
jgi:hypothetical protein